MGKRIRLRSGEGLRLEPVKNDSKHQALSEKMKGDKLVSRMDKTLARRRTPKQDAWAKKNFNAYVIHKNLHAKPE